MTEGPAPRLQIGRIRIRAASALDARRLADDLIPALDRAMAAAAWSGAIAAEAEAGAGVSPSRDHTGANSGPGSGPGESLADQAARRIVTALGADLAWRGFSAFGAASGAPDQRGRR